MRKIRNKRSEKKPSVLELHVDSAQLVKLHGDYVANHGISADNDLDYQKKLEILGYAGLNRDLIDPDAKPKDICRVYRTELQYALRGRN